MVKGDVVDHSLRLPSEVAILIERAQNLICNQSLGLVQIQQRDLLLQILQKGIIIGVRQVTPLIMLGIVRPVIIAIVLGMLETRAPGVLLILSVRSRAI